MLNLHAMSNKLTLHTMKFQLKNCQTLRFMHNALEMNKFDGTQRINASIPKEFSASIRRHADDLNLTPSNFIALCVESILEIMDAEKPVLPYFVNQYRFLKENGQLRSQNSKSTTALKSSEPPRKKKSTS